MSNLPPAWEWANLDEVAEVQGGIQKQQKRRPIENKFPFLRVANVPRGSLNLSEVHEIELFDGELEKYALRSGDLLVVEGNGSIDQLGRAAVWRGEIDNCVHQNHLIRVRPSSVLDERFLGLVWNSPVVVDQIRQVAGSTSGLHTLSVSKLNRIRLPMPPLAEQQRIVAVLEDHLSRLDAAHQSLIRARRQLVQLSGSVRNTEIITSDCRWGTLGDVLSDIEAGKSFGAASRPASADEWGIIKVSAMTWGEFRENENKAVPPDREIDSRNEIRPGDILVSRANTENYVGAPVLVRNTRPKLLLSDKSLRLIPKAGVDPNWLIEVLSSPVVRKQISKRATGTKDSMRNISQAALREIRIPISPTGRQGEIASSLSVSMDSIQRLDQQIEKAEAHRTSLWNSLFADAFAGRLVAQDPSDEPASALLERIKTERAAQPKRTRRTSTKTEPAQETLL